MPDDRMEQSHSNPRLFLWALIFATVPLFIFLAVIFSQVVVVTTAIALVILVFCLYQDRNLFKPTLNTPKLKLTKLWPVLVATLVIVTPVNFLPFDTADWQKNFAIINLLLEGNFPPTIDFAGQPHYLRYYLSFFMLPLLLAQAGIPTHIAFYLYSLVAMLLVFILVCQNFTRSRQVWAAVLIIFSFGGLELIGMWLNNGISSFLHISGVYIHFAKVPPNIHWIVWCLQHAMITWLAVVMLLKYPALSVRYGGVITVAMFSFSAMTIFGFLPMLFYYTYQNGGEGLLSKFQRGFKALLTIPNAVIAPLLALPLLIYFASTKGFHTMWKWEAGDFRWLEYTILFVSIVFVVSILLVAMNRRRLKLAVILVCTLLACSLYVYGVPNELLARSSIAIVFLWSLWMLESFLHGSKDNRVVIATYLIIVAIPAYTDWLHKAQTKKVDTQINYRGRKANFELYYQTRIHTYHFSPKDKIPAWLLRKTSD